MALVTNQDADEWTFDWSSADKYRIRYVGNGWWGAFAPGMGIEFGRYSSWEMAMAAVSYSILQKKLILSHGTTAPRTRTTTRVLMETCPECRGPITPDQPTTPHWRGGRQHFPCPTDLCRYCGRQHALHDDPWCGSCLGTYTHMSESRAILLSARYAALDPEPRREGNR